MKNSFDIKDLHRSRHDKIITGLAGGLAKTFGFEPFYVRVALVVGIFFAPMLCGLSYLIGSLLIKER